MRGVKLFIVCIYLCRTL